ncbi:hypothetical protein M5689_007627 [Euphorbia peplus]|nr:hypothetical protein M5689_007627 [Euphorbia peplus]
MGHSAFQYRQNKNQPMENAGARKKHIGFDGPPTRAYNDKEKQPQRKNKQKFDTDIPVQRIHTSVNADSNARELDPTNDVDQMANKVNKVVADCSTSESPKAISLHNSFSKLLDEAEVYVPETPKTDEKCDEHLKLEVRPDPKQHYKTPSWADLADEESNDDPEAIDDTQDRNKGVISAEKLIQTDDIQTPGSTINNLNVNNPTSTVERTEHVRLNNSVANMNDSTTLPLVTTDTVPSGLLEHGKINSNVGPSSVKKSRSSSGKKKRSTKRKRRTPNRFR